MAPLPEQLASLPVGTVVALNSVVFDGVNANLLDFTARLAMIHRLVFGIPMVITSAKDGSHVPGSLHAAGLALDIRTADKDPDMVALLIHFLAFAASTARIAYFDERQLPGEPHLHLEWHGN